MDSVQTNYSIRPASDDDIDRLHKWLQDEAANEVHGNFLCNWGLIQRHHADGNLVLCVGRDDQTILRYLAGGITRDGILQVHSSWRGRGIGRALAEHGLDVCAAQDKRILFVECAPATSFPFWTKLGFTRLDERFAYRTLALTHDLPTLGEPIDVSIAFFPQEKKYGESPEPIVSARPKAIQVPGGRIYLGERVFFPDCLYAREEDLDAILEIVVAGRTIYCDKVKYDAASKIGLNRCDNGYQMDYIDPDGAHHGV